MAAGVEQRATLIEAILQDIYGEAKLVESGALPAAALTGSVDFVRAMRGVEPPGGRHMPLYACDLGRGPDGRWWVLDDRTQAPSGAGYALENRLVLSRAYPALYNRMNVQRLAPFFDGMRKGLSASAQRSDPRICLLTPGPFSETYFGQAQLARYLGLLLVEGDDLLARDGKVYLRTIAGLKRADVILRRVDADYLDPLELNGASQLGVPGILEAIREGGVAMVNMPGTGVMESKALLGFMPKLCRIMLGETLKLPNVATWWCGQPAEQKYVEDNLSRLVVGPAFNASAGQCSRSRLIADLSVEDRESVSAWLRDRPGDHVGQEVVRLSTMPVLRGDRLEAAPFVLRVYAAWTPDGFRIMPGGFCRTSERPDARAVSMGEGARTADVWVLDDKPVEGATLLASHDDVKIRRVAGTLPSRAADNLFWLGRYLERAEATLRLARSLCTSLMVTETAIHGSGETLEGLQTLLVGWGALDEDALGSGSLEATVSTLRDEDADGSVIRLVRAARRTAASMRERLSADFWTLLLGLETELAATWPMPRSEAEALGQVERALQVLAALSGLAQENINRDAGWRLLDMGRRIERGINACRMARTFAHEAATTDDLDLLLDLVDSQITYRARYLVGLSMIPVRDTAVLDGFNTRSLAFQVLTLKDHLAKLPTLLDDGVPEEPHRVLLPPSTEIETSEAASLTIERIAHFEATLLHLSGVIADRYFLQGAKAVPFFPPPDDL
ncbi:circularly permuted type 2 ATP-grasp protein [Polymorphobacter multimanifer]|uniref:circularly permuted type 2 ATP-grasp protein n=1 Tax=Polymorphobacter multimanifer TaxID=1070431 RepID=UPI00237C2927|nr:circularly permuted type 2 ATP-grasp protein [Polymorphobacter multimanifer]